MTVRLTTQFDCPHCGDLVVVDIDDSHGPEWEMHQAWNTHEPWWCMHRMKEKGIKQ